MEQNTGNLTIKEMQELQTLIAEAHKQRPAPEAKLPYDEDNPDHVRRRHLMDKLFGK